MAGQRSFASGDGSDSSRCQKTDGRRWRCPMPAQPNKSFCSHHRLTTIKIPPSSVQQNPGRVSDHPYIGPDESEEDSQPDNLGSHKKRRRRKEMAVSDLVAERTPDPVSTKKSGSKKKKTAHSGTKQVSGSLDLDKGVANIKNSSVVEVDLVIEKGDAASDQVETIKRRVRTNKKFVDSDDLLDLEAKRDSGAESEIEKLENNLDKAADELMDTGVEETERLLDLENEGNSVNHNHKSSDVKIGVEMEEHTNNDNLDILDSKISKDETIIGGDLDNFEVSSGKASIIEMDSGLDKISENLDLLETNKKKRGLNMKTTDSDIENNGGLDSNTLAEAGGVFIVKVLEMNGAEKVDVDMNLNDKCDQMLDQHHKNDKIKKKKTAFSCVEKINHLMGGKSVDLDVQNLETNSDKTAEKTEVEMGLSGGKDNCKLDMLEKNKNKGERKEEGTASKLKKVNQNLDIIGIIKEREKECVLEVQELEKSSDIVAGVGVSTQPTSGHENDVNLDPLDVKKRKLIDEIDAEAPKPTQNSDETSAVEISVDKCTGLEKPHQILDMFGTDKNSDQSVENSNLDKCNQISRRKRGKEVSNHSEADSDVEMLNQTLGSFKKNKKRGKKENKTDTTEESEAELDPLTLDLMRIAVKRQMEKIEEKNRKEKETEIIELPNGIMAISPRRNNFSTVYAVDRKVGVVVADSCLYQRRFRSKNVEPEPVAVVKKLPMGPRASRGLKKGTCIQKSDKTDMRRGTGTSISKELTIVQNRSSSVQCTGYMISQLRPVLKLLDWEQVLELEIEAKNQGKNLAGVRVQTIECSQDMQYKCNFCRGLIVSLLRGCSNCCYKLCLSCCQEIRGMNLPEEADIMTSDHPTEQKHNYQSAEMHDRMKNGPLSFKTRDEQIPCPPSGLGGCGEEVLIMKLLLPFGLQMSVEGVSHSG